MSNLITCDDCGYRAGKHYIAMADTCPNCKACPFPGADEEDVQPDAGGIVSGAFTTGPLEAVGGIRRVIRGRENWIMDVVEEDGRFYFLEAFSPVAGVLIGQPTKGKRYRIRIAGSLVNSITELNH